jgi:hypothetical protein
MHLHYTQLADGKAVPVAFDGTLIGTRAGNYNPWGNGEKLTSRNCPMNSFVRFDQNGQRYVLAYKPGTGAVGIDRIAANGVGVTGVWSSTWTKGWTHFMPFVRNGIPHYVAYKSATGRRTASGSAGAGRRPARPVRRAVSRRRKPRA